MKLKYQTQINLLYITVYLSSLLTLYFYWDLTYFLFSVAGGWLLAACGMHGSVHMYSAHRSFEPRNKIVKHALLLIGTLAGIGSGISVAILHRTHHKFADTSKDSHSPYYPTKSWANSLRVWFQQFINFTPNYKLVIDLMRDPDHVFWHKIFFKVHLLLFILLLVIDPKLVGYVWAIPILYTYQVVGYLGVGLHTTWGRNILGSAPYNVNDMSSNQFIASIWMPGEGNHNNHHEHPASAKNSERWHEIDLAYWFIKLVGKDIHIDKETHENT